MSVSETDGAQGGEMEKEEELQSDDPFEVLLLNPTRPKILYLDIINMG